MSFSSRPRPSVKDEYEETRGKRQRGGRGREAARGSHKEEIKEPPAAASSQQPLMGLARLEHNVKCYMNPGYGEPVMISAEERRLSVIREYERHLQWVRETAAAGASAAAAVPGPSSVNDEEEEHELEHPVDSSQQLGEDVKAPSDGESVNSDGGVWSDDLGNGDKRTLEEGSQTSSVEDFHATGMHLEEEEFPSPDDLDIDDEGENEPFQDEEEEEEENFESVGGAPVEENDTSPVYELIVRRIRNLLRDPKQAWKTASSRRGFIGGHGRMRESKFRGVEIEALKTALELSDEQCRSFERLKPPQDGKRFLRGKLGDLLDTEGLIHEVSLAYPAEAPKKPRDLQFTTSFVHIDVKEVVLGYFSSPLLRSRAPFHVNPSECSSKRLNGLKLTRAMEQYHELAPESVNNNDFLVFLSLHTDATVKHKTELYPLYMFLPQYDPRGRVQSLESSMILVGWLPVGRHVVVRNDRGVQVPITSVDDKDRYDAIPMLKREALAVLLEHVRSLNEDEGFKFPPGSEFAGRRIRLIMLNHLCDLAELYTLAGVTKDYTRFCPFCYNYKNQCALSNRIRSQDLDRYAFDEECSGDWDILQDVYGVNPNVCPYNRNLFYVDRNYYNVFVVDILHVLDGAVERFWEVALEHHGRKYHLQRRTREWGNGVFGCKAVSVFRFLLVR